MIFIKGKKEKSDLKERINSFSHYSLSFIKSNWRALKLFGLGVETLDGNLFQWWNKSTLANLEERSHRSFTVLYCGRRKTSILADWWRFQNFLGVLARVHLSIVGVDHIFIIIYCSLCYRLLLGDKRSLPLKFEDKEMLTSDLKNCGTIWGGCTWFRGCFEGEKGRSVLKKEYTNLEGGWSACNGANLVLKGVHHGYWRVLYMVSSQLLGSLP